MNPTQYELLISQFVQWTNFYVVCGIVATITFALFFLLSLPTNYTDSTQNKKERKIFLSAFILSFSIYLVFSLVFNKDSIINNNISYINKSLQDNKKQYSVSWYNDDSHDWAYRVYTYENCYNKAESVKKSQEISPGLEKITYQTESKSYPCDFKLVEELSCKSNVKINSCTNQVIEYLIKKDDVQAFNEIKNTIFTVALKK